jgi:hypothetical protein
MALKAADGKFDLSSLSVEVADGRAKEGNERGTERAAGKEIDIRRRERTGCRMRRMIRLCHRKEPTSKPESRLSSAD